MSTTNDSDNPPSLFHYVQPTGAIPAGEPGCTLVSELTGEVLDNEDAVARHALAVQEYTLRAAAAAQADPAGGNGPAAPAGVVKLGFDPAAPQQPAQAAPQPAPAPAPRQAPPQRVSRAQAATTPEAQRALQVAEAAQAQWRAASAQRNALMREWNEYVKRLHDAYAEALAEFDKVVAAVRAQQGS